MKIKIIQARVPQNWHNQMRILAKEMKTTTPKAIEFYDRAIFNHYQNIFKKQRGRQWRP